MAALPHVPCTSRTRARMNGRPRARAGHTRPRGGKVVVDGGGWGARTSRGRSGARVAEGHPYSMYLYDVWSLALQPPPVFVSIHSCMIRAGPAWQQLLRSTRANGTLHQLYSGRPTLPVATSSPEPVQDVLYVLFNVGVLPAQRGPCRNGRRAPPALWWSR